MKCPHCGAPPPPGFVVPVGQFSYRCPFCSQSAVLGAPVAAPPPQVTGPTFIVLHHPGHDDDDDDDHHHHHHPGQYVGMPGAAARNMSWIVWLIIVVVFSLGGSGAAFMRCSKHSKLLSSLVWDGTEPLQCTGVDDLRVTGVTATFTGGSAIIATGNCHLTCTDCTISAPTAIEASGNAQVTIINGSVKGTNLLADASGNARVTISGNVTSSGRTQEKGNAKVSAPASASSGAPTASAAAVATPSPPPKSTPTPAAGGKTKPAATAKPKASR